MADPIDYQSGEDFADERRPKRASPSTWAGIVALLAWSIALTVEGWQ